MLPSGETDLIGASSDIDSDKGQGQVTLDISSPDITTSSSWIFILDYATDSTRGHLETSANTEVNVMHCCQNVSKNFKIISFSIKNVEKSRYIRQKLSCPSLIMDIVHVMVWQVYFCVLLLYGYPLKGHGHDFVGKLFIRF